MKLLEKFLPKVATVEEIHKEFDTAQDRILDECDQILAELKIPTETKIEKKAKMLEELGFVNSETVEQAKRLKENSKEIKRKIEITSKQAETIKYFKQKYPFEKFITTEELDRICNKYNLIHAPAVNYIKDIPEKNVLEMHNVKPLDREDIADDILWCELKKDNAFCLICGNGDSWCGIWGTEWWRIPSKIEGMNFSSQFDADDYLKDAMGFKTKYLVSEIKNFKHSKSGFFVAAPKSHFNLQGLDKKSKFGFFKVQIVEVQDPVVFEYCREGIIRIVSKWGTEDDKAYLDPALQNEILN